LIHFPAGLLSCIRFSEHYSSIASLFLFTSGRFLELYSLLEACRHPEGLLVLSTTVKENTEPRLFAEKRIELPMAEVARIDEFYRFLTFLLGLLLICVSHGPWTDDNLDFFFLSGFESEFWGYLTHDPICLFWLLCFKVWIAILIELVRDYLKLASSRMTRSLCYFA
jgi:hypothetical protein